jgi:hypothetical protein
MRRSLTPVPRILEEELAPEVANPKQPSYGQLAFSEAHSRVMSPAGHVPSGTKNKHGLAALNNSMAHSL